MCGVKNKISQHLGSTWVSPKLFFCFCFTSLSGDLLGPLFLSSWSTTDYFCPKRKCLVGIYAKGRGIVQSKLICTAYANLCVFNSLIWCIISPNPANLTVIDRFSASDAVPCASSKRFTQRHVVWLPFWKVFTSALSHGQSLPNPRPYWTAKPGPGDWTMLTCRQKSKNFE